MSHVAPISMKVATTLAANRIVYVSAAHTVAYPANATTKCVGVTANTVVETTQAIPVSIAGEAYLEFNDSIAAGALVASNNAGQGVPHVDTTAGSYVIGVALEAVQSTGTVAKILINPHFKSIP